MLIDIINNTQAKIPDKINNYSNYQFMKSIHSFAVFKGMGSWDCIKKKKLQGTIVLRAHCCLQNVQKTSLLLFSFSLLKGGLLRFTLIFHYLLSLSASRVWMPNLILILVYFTTTRVWMQILTQRVGGEISRQVKPKQTSSISWLLFLVT